MTSNTVISVEHLTKQYDLGVIGTGTISRDLNRWWARVRKQPDPYTRIGQQDAFARIGESILALDDVSFQVQQGEALGIIGHNGAGKSTLLKILSRVTAPTSGVVKVKGRIGSLLEVGTGFHPELTGRENVYLNGAILGMKKAEVTRKFDEIVAFSGVEKFIDTPVKRYSSGMYVRLAFAVAAHLDPEILIVDEVLAVGDAEFQKKCLGKMGDVAGEGRTVLFVSHNMGAIEHLCKRAILLGNGSVIQDGFSKDVVNLYQEKMIKEIPTWQNVDSNILYQSEDLNNTNNFFIRKIEIFEGEQPVSKIFTWSKIKFRIHYFAPEYIKAGSAVLKISNLKNDTMLLLSTQPGLDLPMEIIEGDHFIECILLDCLPLTAGTYVLGCGLAIPKKEWLCWDEKLTTIHIFERDVYKTGSPPLIKDMAIAIRYSWKVDQPDY